MATRGTPALTELNSDLDRSLQQATAAALAAEENPDQWSWVFQAVVGSDPTEPLTPGGAANGADFHAFLIALAALARRRFHVLRSSGALSGVEEDEVWEFEHRRLDCLVADETKRYIATITKAPDIASLFAVPSGRRIIASPVIHASSEARRCEWCGAPQQLEGLNHHCAFCGCEWFPNKES